MNTTIDIQNIGPVEEFSAELKPGITVLKGPQGVGKTTILRTVELVTTGDVSGKLTKRDGSKVGEATVAGKTLKINRAVRVDPDSELTVEGLGDCDLAAIHTPKFEKAETRDADRIKQLVRLAGIESSFDLFNGLIPQDVSIDPDDVLSDDLVVMAGKVKREIDKVALAAEKESEKDAATAKAKLDAIKGLDLSKDPDTDALRQAWNSAIATESTLKANAAAATNAAQQAVQAKAKLDEALSKQATSVDDALAAQSRAYVARKEADDLVASLKLQLTAAEDASKDAKAKADAADDALKQATLHAQTIESLRQSLASTVTGPTEEELKLATVNKDKAEYAYNEGIRIKDALKVEKEARAANDAAKVHAKRAEKLREAATKCFKVVTDAIGKIPDCPLFVREIDGFPRLCLKTDRSEAEPFDELSDGERWKILIPLATAPNRVVTLSQAGFGELQPANRTLLHNLVAERGGYLLTAQADDGELRAETYKEGT